MSIKFKLYQSIYYSYTDARQSPLKKKEKKVTEIIKKNYKRTQQTTLLTEVDRMCQVLKIHKLPQLSFMNQLSRLALLIL